MKYGGKKNDVVLEHYGDILYKLDNVSRANKFWIKALKYGSGSTLLKTKIKEKKLIE